MTQIYLEGEIYNIGELSKEDIESVTHYIYVEDTDNFSSKKLIAEKIRCGIIKNKHETSEGEPKSLEPLYFIEIEEENKQKEINNLIREWKETKKKPPKEVITLAETLEKGINIISDELNKLETNIWVNCVEDSQNDLLYLAYKYSDLTRIYVIVSSVDGDSYCREVSNNYLKLECRMEKINTTIDEIHKNTEDNKKNTEKDILVYLYDKYLEIYQELNQSELTLEILEKLYTHLGELELEQWLYSTNLTDSELVERQIHKYIQEITNLKKEIREYMVKKKGYNPLQIDLLRGYLEKIEQNLSEITEKINLELEEQPNRPDYLGYDEYDEYDEFGEYGEYDEYELEELYERPESVTYVDEDYMKNVVIKDTPEIEIAENILEHMRELKQGVDNKTSSTEDILVRKLKEHAEKDIEDIMFIREVNTAKRQIKSDIKNELYEIINQINKEQIEDIKLTKTNENGDTVYVICVTEDKTR